MRDFSPEFLDALIEAIDRRRSERQASHGVAETSQRLPSPDRLMEQEAKHSLMVAYRNARRVLSSAQVKVVVDTAEHRIARREFSRMRLNLSRPVPRLSAQELVEIYQSVFARGLPEQEGQE